MPHRFKFSHSFESKLTVKRLSDTVSYRQHYYIISPRGVLLKKHIDNSRIKVDSSCQYPVIFPNHVLRTEGVANSCGQLAIHSHRGAHTLCVVKNLSPLSEDKKKRLVVYDWKGGMVKSEKTNGRPVPDFLLHWREGFPAIRDCFTKKTDLDFDLYSVKGKFEFINVVHAVPGIELCHRDTIRDSLDGFLQSSYHGPDFVYDVKSRKNIVPQNIITSSVRPSRTGKKNRRTGKKNRLSRKKRRYERLHNQPEQMSVGVSTCPMRREKMKDKIAVKYVLQGDAQKVKVAYVTKEDHLQFTKCGSRSIREHDAELFLISQHEETLDLVDHRDHPHGIALTLLVDNNELKLVKVGQTSQRFDIDMNHVRLTKEGVGVAYGERHNSKSDGTNLFDGQKGFFSLRTLEFKARNKTNLLEGPGDLAKFQYYREHYVDLKVPAVTAFHSHLGSFGASQAVTRDRLLVGALSKILLCDPREICGRGILTFGNRTISFFCSNHIDEHDGIVEIRSRDDIRQCPGLSDEEQEHLLAWFDQFGQLSVPTTCHYEFVGDVRDNADAVELFFIFPELGKAVRITDRMTIQFASGDLEHHTSGAFYIKDGRVHYSAENGTVFAWGKSTSHWSKKRISKAAES